jgi:small conductance mechanosensitive channel
MSTFAEGVLRRLGEAFAPERIGAWAGELLADLLVGVLAFLAFVAVWKVLDVALRAVLRRARTDTTSARFAENGLKWVMLGIGLVQALTIAGVNTPALLGSVGLAGLSLGFAARDALSNVVSGVLIYLDRPFVIGDLVEVEGQYGRVDRITLRSTRVVTLDGRMLAVPNTVIINTTVASYTNFPHLRLDIDATVAVTEDLARVRRLLLELVQDDAAFLGEPAPRVIVRALNDYNVAVELQVWLKDEREHIPRRFALRERVFETLRAAGVEIPYETFALAPVTVRGEDATSVAAGGPQR